MPPVITPDETGSNLFRATSSPDKPKRASRAVCKDCDWEYDPPQGTNQLIVFAHAAGHSYRGDHEIRFEEEARR